MDNETMCPELNQRRLGTHPQLTRMCQRAIIWTTWFDTVNICFYDFDNSTTQWKWTQWTFFSRDLSHSTSSISFWVHLQERTGTEHQPMLWHGNAIREETGGDVLSMRSQCSHVDRLSSVGVTAIPIARLTTEPRLHWLAWWHSILSNTVIEPAVMALMENPIWKY